MSDEPEVKLAVPSIVSGEAAGKSPRTERKSPRPPLMALIQGLLPGMKRAQHDIAEAIIRDPELFITQTISELAKTCGVSTGSIVLFCRALGLKGFPALKIALARELAEPVLPFYSKQIKGKQGTPRILQRVLEEHVASLQQTLNLNTAQGLNAAASAMLKARRVVFFSIGLSYPVAYSIYARMRLIGLPGFIEFDSHLQLAAAAEMQSGDVALGISVAGNTSETVECLRVSKARGARTICITNSVGSPLARAADIRLYAAPSEVKYFQAPLASRVSQLALGDALLVILGTRRKRESVAHLERAEEHLLRRRMHSAGGASRAPKERPPRVGK